MRAQIQYRREGQYARKHHIWRPGMRDVCIDELIGERLKAAGVKCRCSACDPPLPDAKQRQANDK